MSRWVRCSYGKRAGFVAAKIGIFLLFSKFFEGFLPFFAKKIKKDCKFFQRYSEF